MDPRKKNFLILGVFGFLFLIAAVCGVIYWNRKSLFDKTPDGRTLDENRTPDQNRIISPDENKETQKGRAEIAELVNKVLPKVEAFEAADLPESDFSTLMKELDEIFNKVKATEDGYASNPEFFKKFCYSNMFERAVINNTLKLGGNVEAVHQFALKNCSAYGFRFLHPRHFLVFPQIKTIPRPPFDEEYVCMFDTLHLLFTIMNFIKSKGEVDNLLCLSAMSDIRKKGSYDSRYDSFFPKGCTKFITDGNYYPRDFKEFLKNQAEAEKEDN
jgi:hypothetical protein